MKVVLGTTLALAAYFSGYSTTFARELNSDDVATLYRGSPAIENARIHIATFDADDSYDGSTFQYNWTNCLIAADLFVSQRGVIVRYWCERGYHKD